MRAEQRSASSERNDGRTRRGGGEDTCRGGLWWRGAGRSKGAAGLHCDGTARLLSRRHHPTIMLSAQRKSASVAASASSLSTAAVEDTCWHHPTLREASGLALIQAANRTGSAETGRVPTGFEACAAGRVVAGL
eukprot:449184-Rhodomonas_salina.1